MEGEKKYILAPGESADIPNGQEVMKFLGTQMHGVSSLEIMEKTAHIFLVPAQITITNETGRSEVLAQHSLRFEYKDKDSKDMNEVIHFGEMISASADTLEEMEEAPIDPDLTSNLKAVRGRVQRNKITAPALYIPPSPAEERPSISDVWGVISSSGSLDAVKGVAELSPENYEEVPLSAQVISPFNTEEGDVVFAQLEDGTCFILDVTDVFFQPETIKLAMRRGSDSGAQGQAISYQELGVGKKLKGEIQGGIGEIEEPVKRLWLFRLRQF